MRLSVTHETTVHGVTMEFTWHAIVSESGEITVNRYVRHESSSDDHYDAQTSGISLSAAPDFVIDQLHEQFNESIESVGTAFLDAKRGDGS